LLHFLSQRRLLTATAGLMSNNHERRRCSGATMTFKAFKSAKRNVSNTQLVLTQEAF